MKNNIIKVLPKEKKYLRGYILACFFFVLLLGCPSVLIVYFGFVTKAIEAVIVSSIFGGGLFCGLIFIILWLWNLNRIEISDIYLEFHDIHKEVPRLGFIRAKIPFNNLKELTIKDGSLFVFSYFEEDDVEVNFKYFNREQIVFIQEEIKRRCMKMQLLINVKEEVGNE